jgi:hypothetical protein
MARFVADSLLEEGGFEPSVPLCNLGTLQLHSGLLDPMIATDNGRQGFTISVMGSPKMIRAGRLLWFRELEGPCFRRLRSQRLSVWASEDTSFL